MATVLTKNASPPAMLIKGMPVFDCAVFRYASSIGIGSEVVIQDTGGQTITLPYFAVAVSNLKIKSSSANDASPSGSGVRTVRIWSFNSSYELQYEDAAMNGTTLVSLTNTYKFIIGIESLTSGGSGAGVAAGNITVTDNAGTTYYCAIDTGENRGFTGYIYVPNGYTAVIDINYWFTTATTASDAIMLKLYKAISDLTGYGLIFSRAHSSCNGASYSQPDDFNFQLEAGLYKIAGVDIGTTAQTMNWSIFFGYHHI